MGIVNASSLVPGMVLAENVLDNKGRMLLSQGTKITDKHIGIFLRQGVLDVNIEGISEEDIYAFQKSKVSPQAFEKAEKEMKDRFRHTDPTREAIAELIKIVTLRRAKQIQAGVKTTSTPEWTENDLPENFHLEARVPILLDEEDMILPSLPIIFYQIQNAIDQPNSSAKLLADIISKDTSLAARLLKLVNSALYSFSSKVDSLSRAVSIVGTEQICSLALGITIASVFKDIPSELVHMRSFWEHSVACGLCAKRLGQVRGMENPERLFTAGLLHDIGRLILYQNFPDRAKKILIYARKEQRLLYEVEKELMGREHAFVGAQALKKWKLPPDLVDIVKCHHNPRKSENLLESALVHVADTFANSARIGSSGDKFVPPLALGIWSAVELNTSVIATAIKEMQEQFNEVVQFLFGDLSEG